MFFTFFSVIRDNLSGEVAPMVFNSRFFAAFSVIRCSGSRQLAALRPSLQRLNRGSGGGGEREGGGQEGRFGLARAL